MTENEQIERMRKGYKQARKRINKAIRECVAGTAVHLQHIKALSELDKQERAEEIALGLSPQNLGAAITTSFTYIAHCPVIPSTPEQRDQLLHDRLTAACKGLHIEPDDEAIRQQLAEEFCPQQESL